MSKFSIMMEDKWPFQVLCSMWGHKWRKIGDRYNEIGDKLWVTGHKYRCKRCGARKTEDAGIMKGN